MRNQAQNGLLLLAAGFALAACTDRPESAPTAPTFKAPSLSVNTLDPFTVLPCDFTLLKADARNYAKSGGDALFTIIGDLQKAKQKTTAEAIALANEKVFDGLARMAAIRGTKAMKTDATGSGFDNLVHRFFGCVGDDNIWKNAHQGDFTGALGDGWMFEVRGGAGDPQGVAYERTDAGVLTWWGLQPVGSSWSGAITTTALAKRVLIYGYRTDFLGDVSGKLGSSFETRTIPHIQTTPPAFAFAVKVGLCVADDELAPTITGTERVNHANTFLPKEALTCTQRVPPYTIASNNLGSLTNRALAFFGVQPAYAATMFFGGSIAAAPSELSPSAVYDLSQIKLVFDTIANSFVNTALTSKTTPAHEVRVYAYSTDAVPVLIPGVDVVVTIAGNNSTISGFGGTSTDSVTITSTSVTAKGSADGYAKLTGVQLTKSGGFTLAARVNVAGVQGNPFLSLAFNIQNK
jgi:hypothetical protein